LDGIEADAVDAAGPIENKHNVAMMMAILTSNLDCCLYINIGLKLVQTVQEKLKREC